MRSKSLSWWLSISPIFQMLYININITLRCNAYYRDWLAVPIHFIVHYVIYLQHLLLKILPVVVFWLLTWKGDVQWPGMIGSQTPWPLVEEKGKTQWWSLPCSAPQPCPHPMWGWWSPGTGMVVFMFIKPILGDPLPSEIKGTRSTHGHGRAEALEQSPGLWDPTTHIEFQN